MLSIVELTASVAPTKVSAPRVPAVVWKGAVPVHVGDPKLFQSVQPAVFTLRLPSASSKPESSAIEPLAPQPVEDRSRGDAIEAGPKPGKSEEPRLESEWRAVLAEEWETDEACPWARESVWVELMAIPAAAASRDPWCAAGRLDAAPNVNDRPRTTARTTVI